MEQMAATAPLALRLLLMAAVEGRAQRQECKRKEEVALVALRLE